MRLASRLFLLLFLSVTNPATQADVTSKGEAGFNLKITGVANVPPAVAYEQFLDIGECWLSSHTWYRDASNLSVEAKAGGCFCEKSDGSEVLQMLVTFIKPNAEIKMVDGLGPLQMMDIHSGMSWSFEPAKNGTLITLTYNVTGYAPGGLSDIADIDDAVQTDQLNALVKHLFASR